MGKLDVTEVPGKTQGVMDFSGNVLGNWDTYHPPDEGEILTTTQYLQ